MSGKYVIATNEKELKKNLDYLSNKYYKQEFEKNGIVKFVLKRFQAAWKGLFGGRRFYPVGNPLYSILSKEVELYYLNNYLDICDIRIKKAFNKKEQEKKNSVNLSLVLSLISALLYSWLSYVFDKDVRKGILLPFINTLKYVVENLSKIFNLAEYSEELCNFNKWLLELAGVALVSVALFSVLCVVIIRFVSYLFGERNFEDKVVREYELDFLERMSNEENHRMYTDAIAFLNEFSEAFFWCIYIKAYKFLSDNNRTEGAIDELIHEIEGFFQENPILLGTREFDKIFDKKIVIRSLIHRAFLTFEGSEGKLVVEEGKIYLRDTKDTVIEGTIMEENKNIQLVDETLKQIEIIYDENYVKCKECINPYANIIEKISTLRNQTSKEKLIVSLEEKSRACESFLNLEKGMWGVIFTAAGLLLAIVADILIEKSDKLAPLLGVSEQRLLCIALVLCSAILIEIVLWVVSTKVWRAKTRKGNYYRFVIDLLRVEND